MPAGRGKGNGAATLAPGQGPTSQTEPQSELSQLPSMPSRPPGWRRPWGAFTQLLSTNETNPSDHLNDHVLPAQRGAGQQHTHLAHAPGFVQQPPCRGGTSAILATGQETGCETCAKPQPDAGYKNWRGLKPWPQANEAQPLGSALSSDDSGARLTKLAAESLQSCSSASACPCQPANPACLASPGQTPNLGRGGLMRSGTWASHATPRQHGSGPEISATQ